MIHALLKRCIAASAIVFLAWMPIAQAQDTNAEWEGLYAGGIIGIAWSSFDITAGNQAMTHNATSVTGGGFLGFNTLLTENILAGIESDIVFSDLSGNFSFASHRASWVGRLGLLVRPNALLYGLAGITSGNFTTEVTTQGTVASMTTFIEIDDEGVIPIVTTITTPGIRVEESKRLWGFTVGGGIEKDVNLFAQPIRLGLEYRYSNFNEWDLVVAGQLFEIDPEIHEMRFRAVFPLN